MGKIRIGVLGLAMRPSNLIGGNLGCYALGYSFFEIMNTIASQSGIQIQIVQIRTSNIKGILVQIVQRLLFRKDIISDYYSGLYKNLDFRTSDVLCIGGRMFFVPAMLGCDCIFDFTAGDSFTDLYGKDRFYERTGLKKKIIDSGIPLILGSQTIGPFKDADIRKYAVDVIERSNAVFVRDVQSKQYVEKISHIKPILTTDVAFFLPYVKHKEDGGRKKAGFNPSGLVWMGGYTENNQFGLTVDYQQYCKTIIEFLLTLGYEVHLIYHVFLPRDTGGIKHADNDKIAVDALHEMFPMTITSPMFSTPMEAKSYISGMDLFIGARMHATIAAISAGIPVIPFSYSRKFEGLFFSLDYPYVIEGTKWETEVAIQKTKEWLESLEELKKCLESCSSIINDRNEYLLRNYMAIVRKYIKPIV